jgi:dethiobiotin synthetase
LRLVVTGTDTNIGKTVFAAALAAATGAHYWKPIQAGLDQPTDSERVSHLSGLPPDRILREAYVLRTPASIHRSAELDGIAVDQSRLELPRVPHVVIEGAGGALVPITRRMLLADLFAQWDLPVVIVARTTLGTINHSLLTIEALRTRGIMIRGIAFVGDANEDSEQTISEIGRVRRLGRLPWLRPLHSRQLADAFAASFRIEDFR